MSEHDPGTGSEPNHETAPDHEVGPDVEARSETDTETRPDTETRSDTESMARSADSTTAPSPVTSRWRHPVRLILTAVVLGALVTAAVIAAVGGFRDAGSIDSSGIGASERGPEPNAFNQSPGAVSVGPTTSTSTTPSSSSSTTTHPFGDDAPWPTREQFVALRDETCPVQVNRYLNGRFDPNGRFSVGLLYPSRRQWDDGERAMRCGIQLADSTGELTPFLGRVADLDQSLHWPVGTCVGIDATSRQPTDAVDCTQRHAFQVTGLIDLGQRFGAVGAGRPWPNVDQQNGELRQRCSALTNAFFGTPAKFVATTLNVQWSTIAQVSWLSGTRTAVCYVGLPDRGGFATLVGDAKGNLLINGRVPTPPATEPPGRLNPTPVPLPGGIAPNPTEVPAPAG